jgi:predicted nucleic acid-binding protein
LSIFVDSSAWFAASVTRDRNNARMKAILRQESSHTTTDDVLVETWFLNGRYHRDAGERFWDRLRTSNVRIETVAPVDLEAAWAIGVAFSDQPFSIVDRTSFAIMERLGITRVASLDDDFAVYRYGRGRQEAFEVLRSVEEKLERTASTLRMLRRFVPAPAAEVVV